MKKKLTMVSGLIMLAGICFAKDGLTTKQSLVKRKASYWTINHAQSQNSQRNDKMPDGLRKIEQSSTENNAIGSFSVIKAKKEISEYWDNNNTEWTNPIFYIRTYNSDANITEEIGGSETGMDTFGRTLYTYNADKKIIEQKDQDRVLNEWENARRYVSTYNLAGNGTEYLSQEWDGAEWKNLNRGVSIYDEKGFYKEYRYEVYSNGTWEINYGDRRTNTYNVQNIPTEAIYSSYDDSSGTWIDEQKEKYTYNAEGVLTQVDIQEFNATTQIWTNSVRIADIQWFNWSGFDNDNSELKSYTLKTWEVASFVTSGRLLRSHPDEFGSRVVLFEMTADGGVTFTGVNKSSTLNDSYGNEINYIDESFDGTAWVIDYQSKNIITYNSEGAMTERIRQNWDSNDEVLVNSQRSTYSNFQKFEGVGVSSSTILDGFSVFPNPSSTSSEIKYTIDQNSTVSIDIYNAIGVKVESVVNAEMQSSGTYNYTFTPDVAGMYFVRVQLDGKVATVKLSVLK